MPHKVFLWNPDADEPKQIKYGNCNNGECTFEMFQEMLKNSAITEEKLKTSVYCNKSWKRLHPFVYVISNYCLLL